MVDLKRRGFFAAAAVPVAALPVAAAPAVEMHANDLAVPAEPNPRWDAERGMLTFIAGDWYCRVTSDYGDRAACEQPMRRLLERRGIPVTF